MPLTCNDGRDPFAIRSLDADLITDMQEHVLVAQVNEHEFAEV